mgnify:CR=1 FL=1
MYDFLLSFYSTAFKQDLIIQKEIIDKDVYTTAVLSGNRNFDGRIHPYAKQAFLASPPLVVAYALAGTIRFDIENGVIGEDVNGVPIFLSDLWPTDEEIDAIVNKQRLREHHLQRLRKARAYSAQEACGGKRQRCCCCNRHTDEQQQQRDDPTGTGSFSQEDG